MSYRKSRPSKQYSRRGKPLSKTEFTKKLLNKIPRVTHERREMTKDDLAALHVDYYMSGKPFSQWFRESVKR